MSLHGPAGACILVASVSPIHVFPIQRVLKHCGAAHKHLRTPQLVGFARQLGCKKACIALKYIHVELALCFFCYQLRISQQNLPIDIPFDMIAKVAPVLSEKSP